VGGSIDGYPGLVPGIPGWEIFCLVRGENQSMPHAEGAIFA
jgi:hypothetical protein